MEKKAVLDQRTLERKGWCFCPVQELSKYQNHQLYFGNWFSALPLFLKLKEMGVRQVTSSVRVNQIVSCRLMVDKELLTQRRGSYDFLNVNDSGLHMVKWLYNKGMILLSNLAALGASGIKKRWDRKLRQHIDISTLILSALATRVWVNQFKWHVNRIV